MAEYRIETEDGMMTIKAFQDSVEFHADEVITLSWDEVRELVKVLPTVVADAKKTYG